MEGVRSFLMELMLRRGLQRVSNALVLLNAFQAWYFNRTVDIVRAGRKFSCWTKQTSTTGNLVRLEQKLIRSVRRRVIAWCKQKFALA